VARLVEESFIADLLGFPTDCWIARELIPTKAAFYAFRGNMPIVKERRYFVQDGKVVCHHPYWPAEAIENRVTNCVCNSNWVKLLYDINKETDYEIDLLSRLSGEVGDTIRGEWSIDWLWSESLGKWFLIDMADANQSYHWAGCSENSGVL